MVAIDAKRSKAVAVVVAHPDDETLWAGGTILSHPSWNFHILTLCRASDADRAPRFRRALSELGATGAMADLDDGPGQLPLEDLDVQAMILSLLPARRFDLILTHDPAGEYTRHLRHEEVGRAIISLWHAGQLATEELWTFAYEDGGRAYLPRPIPSAPVQCALTEGIWRRKFAIIISTYGFPADGFEAQTTPRREAFWQFADSDAAAAWLQRGGGWK